jgi:hypothetical protein
MQNYKIVAYLLLGYFWLVKKKMIKILLMIEASLATAEVSAGAVAKADQKFQLKEVNK